ncbi:MAG TPA: hypothetical protein PKD26_06935 [Pyrinomonadaceae bacterium]|nr:hypothetical protein [Pyrinomonadaceae bacterium]
MPEPISLALSFGLGYVALASIGSGSMNTAVSPEASVTRNAVAKLIESKQKSESLFGKKADVIAAINTLVNECSSVDWDGYGAAALDPLAAWNAEEFIKALPDNLVMPEISPEPDGSVSLDWTHSRNQIVSVSIGTSNRIALAWLNGAERGHAVVNFDGTSIPQLIIDRIQANEPYGYAPLRFA